MTSTQVVLYDPSVLDLDDLEGLTYWDQLRLRHPEQVNTTKFLDNYRLDHLAEVGHEPRARWYKDARQRLRIKAQVKRANKLDDKRKLMRNPAYLTSWVDPFRYRSDMDLAEQAGPEEYADSTTHVSLRVNAQGRITAFDRNGKLVESKSVLTTQSSTRLVDRTVSEAKIFHPVKGDGLTLDELLDDMARFERVLVDSEDGPDPDETPIDPRYGRRPEAARKIRKMREVIEDAELRARAIEICRFPWNDLMADRDDKMARGWIARSKLHDWGTDTWQILVTRKRHRKTGPSKFTVFVRTHVGTETITKRDGSRFNVWTWMPHYWKAFDTETEALDWMQRLSDAFVREAQGDLDHERWPQNLVNDRSVAASQHAEHSDAWRRWDREGWSVTNLDRMPGQIPFVPGEANTWDPHLLTQLADAEAPVPEPVQ